MADMTVMPVPTPKAFALIADERNAAVGAALVEALPHVPRAQQEALLSILIERGQSAGLAALVGRFAEFDEATRGFLVAHADDLFAGVRPMIESPSFEQRAGAIDLIVTSQSTKLAYLLGRALRSACAKTRERAATALYDMASAVLPLDQDHMTAPGAARAACGADDIRYIADALRTAVVSWEIHTQPQTLTAAMRLGDLVEPAIRRKLEEPRTNIAHAIGDILATGTDPSLAGFCLRAVAIAPIRAAGVRAIGRTQDVAFIRSLAANAWLLTDNRIRRDCIRIREFRWLERGVDNLLTLDADEAAAVVRLYVATGVPRDRKIALLRSLVDSGVDALARAAVWALVDDKTDGATDALGLVATRGDSELARIARSELWTRRPETLSHPGPLGEPATLDVVPDARSTVMPTATLAGATGTAPDTTPAAPSAVITDPGAAAGGAAREAARSGSRPGVSDDEPHPPARIETWAAYWGAFDDLAPEQRAAWRDRARDAGDDLARQIGARLQSGDPADRARALRVVRALRLEAAFAETIYRLARDADALVRSTAVGALPALPGPTTQRILRDLVDDPEARVQANAIEALDELGGTAYVPIVEPKLASPSSRVRANAIKALLKHELYDAGDALLAMLEDPSGAHRLSALWVIERLRLGAVLDRVEALCARDPDARVRRRAGRLRRSLARRDDAMRACAAHGASAPVRGGSSMTPGNNA
ncbi:MAG: HEAT repeat domain-containing protein [Phycisphaerae bacterium]